MTHSVFIKILGATLFTITVTVYAGYFANRVVPNTWVGDLSLGGKTRDQVAQEIGDRVSELQRAGIRLTVNNKEETIQLQDIGFDMNVGEAVDRVFERGHGQGLLKNVWQRLAALGASAHIQAPVRVDPTSIDFQIKQIASTIDVPRQDIRLAVTASAVRIATDTRPGQVIDRTQGVGDIEQSLGSLNTAPIPLYIRDDQPIADPSSAPQALVNAKKILSRSMLVTYQESQFYVSRERIASWLISEYEGSQLKAGLNKELIAQYVTIIAQVLNVPPEPPQVSTSQGRITGFTPPKVGQSVQEDELISSIISTLMARVDADKAGDTVAVPMKTTNVSVNGLDSLAGISELIGKATTPFTGSPKNRILNIKNGVKFISGTVVQPGQEFSTLKTLGTIDNTTGYLPELVIKGNRTQPDFGGGLCQVSTTLFRAVMDSGLPVTARRNHSYRVTYYEKDGEGKFIGPGLDATIYVPDLDFKFRNDSENPVLLVGYVVGDKVTFELYGTKDGRTSTIDGPHLLKETPSGEPVYIQTDSLPLGMKQQVEVPHPGGTAVATYTVTYADGTKKKQVFNSYYRPWPAQYLMGTNPNCSTAAQCAALVATPAPSPSPSPSPSPTP